MANPKKRVDFMEFTKEQLSELTCRHTDKENGLQDLLDIMLERLMVSERREYLQEESIAGEQVQRLLQTVCLKAYLRHTV